MKEEIKARNELPKEVLDDKDVNAFLLSEQLF